MINNTATKKTNKRKNLLKKQLAKEKKKERKQAQPEVFNTPALHLVHDAQGLAEKLFKSLRASKDRWEVQLMMMNLISRLIAVHELLILNFYPYLERCVVVTVAITALRCVALQLQLRLELPVMLWLFNVAVALALRPNALSHTCTHAQIFTCRHIFFTQVSVAAQARRDAGACVRRAGVSRARSTRGARVVAHENRQQFCVGAVCP
jgi:hypothetical protein